MSTDELKPIHDPTRRKLDADLDVAELLRDVADELEEMNDRRALSHMGRGRVYRLVQDLRGARALRFYDPRTEKVEEFVEGSYLTDGDE